MADEEFMIEALRDDLMLQMTLFDRGDTDDVEFNLSVDDYTQRYFIGHYSPAGNHFFAHSIKDAIVDWLDPKPITYRQDGQARIGFREGYLLENRQES